MGKIKRKIGRNDLCTCGSGKKYKKCCLKKDRANSTKINAKVFDSNNEYSSNKKIRDNPSFKKLDKTIGGAKAFKNVVDQGLIDGLSYFGADMDKISDTLSKMVGMEEEFEFLANINDRFNEHFLDRGWIAHESINFEAMKNAVELADQGLLDEAESVLIEAYHENLEISIQMIKWIEGFRPRTHFIKLAYDDYLAERYHSCILLLFTIIDGVVADTKEIDGNKGFFAEGEEIYAWDSIAAHQTGLTELRKLLYQNRGTTTYDEIDIPYRNGIMHGRDLGYANKKVAIKLWATVLALRDGIISIKQKGTEPPDEPAPLTLEGLIELNENRKLRDKLLKEWKNRELEVNKDFPETGISEEYIDGTPEKALVEFFELWKAKNFGKIAQKIDHMNFSRTKLNNLAGKLSREVFKDKKLDSFKILDRTDQGPAISEITAEIVIHKKEEIITKEITFRMIYENNEGQIEMRTMNNGYWKFIRCFSEIGNL
jgi:Predicted metal-binding protein related to the C-terminal domain of SecA